MEQDQDRGRRRARYDLQFKHTVVDHYIAGATGAQTAKKFGLGRTTPNAWARELGRRKADSPEAVYMQEVRSPRLRNVSLRAKAEAAIADMVPVPRTERAARRASFQRAAEATAVGDHVEALRWTRVTRHWDQVLASRGDPALAAAARAQRYLEARAARAAEREAEAAAVNPGEPWAPHAAQTPPAGDWRTWLFMGGRGAGKTRAGAEWLAALAEADGGARLALVGPTLHDVREVMIDGPSGLLHLPGRERPRYEKSRRRLVWANGAVAQGFSAEDPESLRGPQFSAAWADELCVWPDPAGTLALLRMGLRLGGGDRGEGTGSRGQGSVDRGEGTGVRGRDGGSWGANPDPQPPSLSPEPCPLSPRLVVTTTPKPLPALRGLLAEPGCALSRAGTAANRAHLAPAFLEGVEALYGGTRLAAQEIEGVLVEAGEGALWRAEELRRCRGPAPARLDRVVVAVDPPASAGGDACGIVVAGRAGERAYVLADRTAAGLSPLGWARRAAEAAREWGAAAIVAEANQGGDMVRATLAGVVGAQVAVKLAHAVRSKRTRAEPVAALYEQGRVTHCGAFAALEEELMALGAADGPAGGSPDRADALVWALSELMLGGPAPVPRIRVL